MEVWKSVKREVVGCKNMKYTQEVVDAIVASLREGVPIKKVCDLVDISEETFYAWQREKPEFSEVVKKARADKIKDILSHIRTAGVGETRVQVQCPDCKAKFETTITLPTKAWQALAWILERTENEDFGRRYQVGGGKEPIKHIIEFVDGDDT